MGASETSSDKANEGMLLLGIDTCGPIGSVALGRLCGGSVQILGEVELEGRSYAATLLAAVGELLTRFRVPLRDVSVIVSVSGPGSFTGVRVGLSAVKGLAEGARIPVVAVSRLEVLTDKAGCVASALDAHRKEVFLRVSGGDGEAAELLAALTELMPLPPPARIAVCDDSAAALLVAAWPQAALVHVAAPTAADAMRLAVARIQGADFADLALLDGHYLRRSDAERVGDAARARTA